MKLTLADTTAPVVDIWKGSFGIRIPLEEALDFFSIRQWNRILNMLIPQTHGAHAYGNEQVSLFSENSIQETPTALCGLELMFLRP